MENLVAVSIDELNKDRLVYSIPKIQRGYRWTNKQIKELLDDLESFFNCKDSYYCLQPLIVQKDAEKLSVIDGQQRLVSMYLLAYYMFERNHRIILLDEGKEATKYEPTNQYDIYYENEDKTIFEILNSDKATTMTERYIKDGYAFICKHIEENKENYKNIRKLDISEIKQILSRIKFIYYQLEDKANEIEIFTNVNIGKLPLNTAEKIKGLMMKSDNFTINESDKEIRSFKINELTANQEMIIEEWSEIEHKLHDNDFFYFFSQNYSESIRINLLFELFARIISNEKDCKNFDAYIEIEKYLKEYPISNIPTLRKFWQQIKELYYILVSWYTDDNLYHYVGYLIYFAGNDYISLIVDLLNEYKNNSKEMFCAYLQKKIKDDLKKYMKNNIDNLSYIDNYGNENEIDKKAIKRILLLFNIENILQNFIHEDIDDLLKKGVKLNERFSFKRFKDSEYQLEHIHSQCDNVKDKFEWFKTLYKYSSTLLDMKIPIEETNKSIHEKLIQLLTEMKKNCEKVFSENTKTSEDYMNIILHNIYFPDEEIEKILDNDERINKIIQDIASLYTDNDIELYKHNICNLTLLDSKTNAGYGNKIFPLKVLFIKNINTTTRFIPVATRNTMLKYYTENPEHNLCWNKKDMIAYLNKIKLYLSYYLENEVETNGK